MMTMSFSLAPISQEVASLLRRQLQDLQDSMSKDDADQEVLKSTAKDIGDEYLQLEKYCNLNYAGLQKILKKHDKLLPEVPCYYFYKSHISTQPWVKGEHQDIQVRRLGVLLASQND